MSAVTNSGAGSRFVVAIHLGALPSVNPGSPNARDPGHPRWFMNLAKTVANCHQDAIRLFSDLGGRCSILAGILRR